MAASDGDNLRRKVFNYICGRGGFVSFPVLLKPPSPLSKMEAAEVVSWLNTQVEENHFFLQYRQGKARRIEFVRLRLKIRLCLTYLRRHSCRFGDGCKNFHICKAFVEGNCKDSAQCGLSHSFHDSANVGKIHELGLGSLPDGSLKNIIANGLPQVCKAYAEGSCQDRNCQSLHICDKFVQYACPFEKLPCELSHELNSDYNSSILKRFGFAGFKDELLICHILLPKGKRLNVEQSNLQRVSIPQENLNDLSGEKKMPGMFGLLGDGKKEVGKGKQKKSGVPVVKKSCSQPEEVPWSQKFPFFSEQSVDIQRMRLDNTIKASGNQGTKEEASPKMNIAGGSSCFMDWSGPGPRTAVRGGFNRGRGRGAVGHDRGRGRSRGREAAVSAPKTTEDLCQPPRPSPWRVQLEQRKMFASQVQMPERPHVSEKIEGSQKKQHEKKKRTRRQKGNIGLQTGSEEIPEETDDLIDLSEEPQSQSMSLVDLSIDDMLSMDGAEKQSAPLTNADDLLDDWLGSLSGQASTQGSTADLLEAELCEENTLGSAAGSGPNERAVVRSICKEYNGTVAFPVLAKRQDLFPCTTQETEKWLRAKPRKFLLLEDEHGEIEEVSVISLGARLCFVYQMKKGNCPKANCYFFHLCKEYVISGTCSYGASCRLDHNFHSSHNHPLLKKLWLADFTDNQLRNLLIASGPQVCLDYNEFSCDKGLRCNRIHVCKDFVKRRCSRSEVECDLAHDLGLSTSHTKRVLEKFHLSSVPPKAVYKMLMVCEDDGATMDDAQKELQMAEHIHHDLDTHICDRFILGHCRKGRGCGGHHCRMPYLWQYKAVGGANQWESFDEAESEDIENVYCDVSQVDAALTDVSISSPESLLIDPGDNSLKVNFTDMQAVADFGTVQLRRLSTKSDGSLSTLWVWYWQDDGNVWRMYGCGEEEASDSDVLSEIESAFLRSELSYGFSTRNRNYKVFFGNKPMYQQNMDPRSYTTREVRRRPVFESREDIQRCTREALGESKNVVDGHSAHSLPAHWSSMQETDTFTRVKLHPSSDEYRRVSQAFHRSLKGNKAVIVGIDRVQNAFMWEKFSRKKEQMRRESCNHGDAVAERQLFHGLSPGHVNITCRKNFNWRLYGQESATFGQGTHFMVDSSLADQSSSDDTELCRFAFFADVLVGSFAQGAPMLLGPPQKCPSDPSSDFYDSCVDDVVTPSVFVVFDADQFYPTFLICYKHVAESTCN